MRGKFVLAIAVMMLSGCSPDTEGEDLLRAQVRSAFEAFEARDSVALAELFADGEAASEALLESQLFDGDWGDVASGSLEFTHVWTPSDTIVRLGVPLADGLEAQLTFLRTAPTDTGKITYFGYSR